MSPSGRGIRPAKMEDYPSILELLEELYSIIESPGYSPITEDQWKTILENEVNHVFVSHIGVSIFGVLHSVRRTTLGQGQVVRIDEMIVASSMQGRGIGGDMIKELINWAKAQGISEVEVSTDKTNEPAGLFYKKHGFQEKQKMMVMEI